MGSRSKTHLAYIAGFLDGDGSLMLQLKKRKDGKMKVRFMPTICFYQDSRHSDPLHWIRAQLGIGYISIRNDGITELRINGYKQIREIMRHLLPYIRFKKYQAIVLLKACDILCKGDMGTLKKKQLKSLVSLIMGIQNQNYVTKRKKTKNELYNVLGLTP